MRSSAEFVQIHFTLEVGKQVGGAIVVKPHHDVAGPFPQTHPHGPVCVAQPDCCAAVAGPQL